MTDEMSWDEVYRANYKSSAFSYFQWLRISESLLASAEKLESGIKATWESKEAHSKDKKEKLLLDLYQGPYFMLMAFAIENLLKAAIVKSKSIELKSTFDLKPRLPKTLEDHDLVKLAQKSNYPISEEKKEEDLLRRLTRSSVWAGRYPVPLNYKASSGLEKFSSGEDFRTSWFSSTDVERLNQLVEDIKAHFKL